MSLYNCPNCNFPKISLYSNPSMDLPHNPTLCQRVNNARDISQNMTSAGKTDWSQINVGGPYLPSFAQSQQYALGVAKGLATNTNQVPQNTLITPNNTIPTSGAYTQYAYDIGGALQNGTIFPSIDPSIFEVKYPDTDIIGRVVSLGQGGGSTSAGGGSSY